MKIANIRKHRNIPFIKRGMKVYFKYYKKYGKITGANDSGNLQIKFDDKNYSENCHPFFELIYYDKNNNIIKEF